MNQIAKYLLELDCVKFSTEEFFTYASGKQGPLYCDNRLLLSDHLAREAVVNEFIRKIKEIELEIDLVCGVATAGIPHATLLADRLQIPLCYIRTSPKEHGRQNQIEGKFVANQSCLVVEDLINRGGSLSAAVTALINARLVPTALVSIVHYNFKQANECLKKFGIPVLSLVSFEDLIQAGQTLKKLNEEQMRVLNSWHEESNQ